MCALNACVQFDVMWCTPISISQNVHKLTGANANANDKRTKQQNTPTLSYWSAYFLSEHVREREDEQAAKDMLDVDKKSNKTQCALPIAISTKKHTHRRRRRSWRRIKKRQNCRVLIYDPHEWRRKSATNYQGIIGIIFNVRLFVSGANTFPRNATVAIERYKYLLNLLVKRLSTARACRTF